MFAQEAMKSLLLTIKIALGITFIFWVISKKIKNIFKSVQNFAIKPLYDNISIYYLTMVDAKTKLQNLVKGLYYDDKSEITAEAHQSIVEATKNLLEFFKTLSVIHSKLDGTAEFNAFN